MIEVALRVVGVVDAPDPLDDLFGPVVRRGWWQCEQ